LWLFFWSALLRYTVDVIISPEETKKVKASLAGHFLVFLGSMVFHIEHWARTAFSSGRLLVATSWGTCPCPERRCCHTSTLMSMNRQLPAPSSRLIRWLWQHRCCLQKNRAPSAENWKSLCTRCSIFDVPAFWRH